jgi:hypothetical protein
VKNARTLGEIADALQDVDVTLELIVEHLGIADQVQSAVDARHVKAERSRLEIERSLGHHVDAEDGDGRR